MPGGVGFSWFIVEVTEEHVGPSIDLGDVEGIIAIPDERTHLVIATLGPYPLVEIDEEPEAPEAEPELVGFFVGQVSIGEIECSIDEDVYLDGEITEVPGLVGSVR